MAKYSEKECCYEEMSKAVGGQSQPQACWDEPFRNSYENTRKEGNNWNWSGMEGEK